VFLGKTGLRPNLECLDCIKNDLKMMNFKRWGKKVKDRSVWAMILKDALAEL
jgi:hypothetical protein